MWALLGPSIGIFGSQVQKTTLRSNPDANYLCLPLWYVGVLLMSAKGVADGICQSQAPLALCGGVAGGTSVILNVLASRIIQREVLLWEGYVGGAAVIAGIVALSSSTLAIDGYCFSIDAVEDTVTSPMFMAFAVFEALFFLLHLSFVPGGPDQG